MSGFGSSFLPKEESVTAAPEVEVSKDYQASSQVTFKLIKILFLNKYSKFYTLKRSSSRWFRVDN